MFMFWFGFDLFLVYYGVLKLTGNKSSEIALSLISEWLNLHFALDEKCILILAFDVTFN